MPSISVVLPAYNEEKNVPNTVAEVVDTLQQITQDYEVIVVNDGSKDRTAEVTRELALENPRVRLVEHEVNRGYGAAVHSGFYAATKELVFMTDADNQFNVSEISKLLPHIGEFDLVIGYRVKRQDPFIRKINAFGWCWLINVLFGYTARDVDCAFKLFKREVLDNVSIESRGATFSAEFLVRAKRKGYRIREVPVTHRPRIAGKQTGARIDVILRAFRELIQFHRRLSREQA
ncbi:MAG: glycosyltransferase family 2 protein [Kiritimatiellia bacterium]